MQAPLPQAPPFSYPSHILITVPTHNNQAPPPISRNMKNCQSPQISLHYSYWYLESRARTRLRFRPHCPWKRPWQVGGQRQSLHLAPLHHHPAPARWLGGWLRQPSGPCWRCPPCWPSAAGSTDRECPLSWRHWEGPLRRQPERRRQTRREKSNKVS